ncbi:D-alanyl-D-alanine carboxypeptidase family protein [Methylopila henanensis]|uniref:serine-type D-Ala-D-Ala carboxypeptidase n=1 Tax=Methylopila henanensis TaxID=873516 RepID=A0ABW4K6P5_9HYPH
MVWLCGRSVGRGAIAFAALVGLGLAAAPARAASPAAKDMRTEAPIAFLYDVTADAALFAKQADLPSPPASMATLMTTEIVFKALADGALKADDQFKVTEDAWRRGGAPSRSSAMFAKLNSQVSVSDLLRGVIVQSGGDAAITLATGLAGSEAAFAERMNERAKALGLTRSTFRNATGQPDPAQAMTARDIARLAAHIIRVYPDRYAMFAEPEFTWNKITQRNRNPLLAEYPGADGLKTGFTADSGYGLVGSVTRDGRRLIVVLNGLETAKARAAEARKLLDWGFDAFQRRRLFEAEEQVAEARVFGGAQRYVPLIADVAVDVLTPKNDDARIVARVVYDGPITAPVEKGARIGVLRVWRGDMLSVETPLRAGEAVPEGDLGRRAVDGALELVGDWFDQVIARI